MYNGSLLHSYKWKGFMRPISVKMMLYQVTSLTPKLITYIP